MLSSAPPSAGRPSFYHYNSLKMSTIKDFLLQDDLRRKEEVEQREAAQAKARLAIMEFLSARMLDAFSRAFLDVYGPSGLSFEDFKDFITELGIHWEFDFYLYSTTMAPAVIWESGDFKTQIALSRPGLPGKVVKHNGEWLHFRTFDHWKEVFIKQQANFFREIEKRADDLYASDTADYFMDDDLPWLKTRYIIEIERHDGVLSAATNTKPQWQDGPTLLSLIEAESAVVA